MAKKFYGGIDLENQSILSLFDSDSSNKVGLLAPATISSDFDLTLPASISAADDVMLADASGNLSFGKIGDANVSSISYAKLNLGGFVDNDDIAGAAEIAETKLALDFSTASLDARIDTLSSSIQNFEWQESVIDKDLTAPPGGESAGDRYLVGLDTTASAATGAWAGQDGNIAEYNGASWVFTTPTVGMFISADDEGDKLYSFGGTVWSAKYFEATTASTGLTKPGGGFDIQLANANANAIQVSSGVFSVNVDDSSIEISTNALQLKDGGVTDAKLAAGISLSKLSALNASIVPVTDGSGFLTNSAITSAELAHLDGVISPIQGQIDGKQADVITTSGDLVVGDVSGDASRLAVGSEGQILKVVGGSVVWAADGGVNSEKVNWVNADTAVKTINHSLASTDVMVQIFDIDSGDTIEVGDVQRNSNSQIVLTASAAPSAVGSGWRVLLLAV